jgi:phosphoribosylanthranilate isomerase
MEPTMATRIKHCGITSLHDAQLAAESGAWALGMIFWPGSPRACDPQEAQVIGQALRRTLNVVGVFVNASFEEIDAIAQAAGLTHIQLHGEEGPAFCTEVARRTGAKIIKATRVRSRADVQAASAFHTDFHLLDAHVEGVPGGTGRTMDWNLVRAAQLGGPVILSGGLHPGNVAAAIAATEPFAVDVASGTELSPGVKDPARLIAFHQAVRGADGEPLDEPDASATAVAGGSAP